MADWDDDDFETEAKPTVIISDKWEGEDEEEEVLDNWDDDGEEKPKEEQKTIQPKDPSKKPGKKSLAKRLKEIEEKERKQREEEMSQSSSMTEEEKVAERLRNQKLAEEADLQLAKDTFGVDSDNVTLVSIDEMKCSTKEDFSKFEELLTSKISSFQSSPHYDSFLESLFVGLFTSLSAENSRRISAAVTAIANEKTKIEKEKSKKLKGKSKAKLVGAKKTGLGDNMVDYSTYNDFDDFM